MDARTRTDRNAKFLYDPCTTTGIHQVPFGCAKFDYMDRQVPPPMTRTATKREPLPSNRQDPVNVYTTTAEYLLASTTTIAWIRQDPYRPERLRTVYPYRRRRLRVQLLPNTAPISTTDARVGFTKYCTGTPSTWICQVPLRTCTNMPGDTTSTPSSCMTHSHPLPFAPVSP
ncbi:hypothetical protein VPH35_044456 [Triticum aestivum]